MKRLLLIFLMTVLTCQMSWAAVASYCQHEEGKAAQHFGHHQHKHHQDSGESKAASSLNVHADCGTCHAGTTGMLPMPDMTHSFNAMPSEQTFITSPFIPSASTERPERPKWIRAV